MFVKQLELGECQRFDNRINDVVDWAQWPKRRALMVSQRKKTKATFIFAITSEKVDQIAYFSLLNSDEA